MRKWYVHDINTSDGPKNTQMRWIESVYRRPTTGELYGLYHTEEGPYVRCGAPYERPYLSVPHIGLAKSTDDGQSWRNLGLILSDGSFPLNCDLPIRFFAGGVGDPSLAEGPDRTHAYIVFTDYSGADATTQGIQVARIALSDLNAPLHVSGAKVFDAEGNYITYIADVALPRPTPRTPLRMQDLPNAPAPSWYVQALGDPGIKGTSALTGQDARLILGDRSEVLLRFQR